MKRANEHDQVFGRGRCLASTVALVTFLFMAVPVSAQIQDEQWVVRPRKIESPPKIDGVLDEPFWDEFEPITDFRQYEPDNRAVPTEKTEVRICYDSRFLYFGVRAYDSEPDKIIARVFERDRSVDDDDSFTVAIDPLNDDRNGVRIENHAGVVETLYWSPTFRVGFQSEAWISAAYDDLFDYVPFSFTVAPGVVIPGGEYRNHQGIVRFRTGRARRIVLSGFFGGGSYYDGHISSANLALTVQPIPQVHLNADSSLDKVDLPGGSFDSLISMLSASYYFSPALATRLTAQYSSLREDFIFNFRMRWIYAPRSEVWLVYDEGHRFGLLEPSLRDRALIAKIVHNFSF